MRIQVHQLNVEKRREGEISGRRTARRTLTLDVPGGEEAGLQSCRASRVSLRHPDLAQEQREPSKLLEQKSDLDDLRRGKITVEPDKGARLRVREPG